MTTRLSRSEQAEAKGRLLSMLKPGDVVYTSLKHVSRSGMYRVIDLYLIRDNVPIRISYTASELLEGYDTKHEGCKVGGCGFDAGFELVYRLGYTLFPDWECVGESCPANDHTNNWNSPRGKGVHHKDGGYSLKQHWL